MWLDGRKNGRKDSMLKLVVAVRESFSDAQILVHASELRSQL